MSIISVKNLTVAFKQETILENVTMEVNKGDFIALIGRSGAGKTTFLNSLAGFIPFEGQINLNGRIAFVFQNNNLFSFKTVGENIEFGLQDKPKEERKQIVKDVLKRIDLENYEKKYPFELSGGQAQRVSLGRAIAFNPTILLLDEPFSALDIFTRDVMISWLLELLQELKITTIMVTHYLDEAIVLSDKVLVFKNKNIEKKIDISFERPRFSDIKFTDAFLEYKKLLNNSLI